MLGFLIIKSRKTNRERKTNESNVKIYIKISSILFSLVFSVEYLVEIVHTTVAFEDTTIINQISKKPL